MKNLRKYGDWALVTGASSGIGQAMSKELAQLGFNLVLVSRREEVLQQQALALTNAHGISARIVAADLAIDGAWKHVVSKTEDLEIGLLVQAAGMETHGSFVKMDEEADAAMIRLNVTTLTSLTRAFGQKMAERGRGGILLVSSIIGHMPNPFLSSYAASKAYVLQLGASLAPELEPYGVDLTVLSPGPTLTPMVEALGKDVNMSKMPMQSHRPEEVARLGLGGLGRKLVVIPGGRNRFMVTMTRHLMSLRVQGRMGAKMMRKALPRASEIS